MQNKQIKGKNTKILRTTKSNAEDMSQNKNYHLIKSISFNQHLMITSDRRLTSVPKTIEVVKLSFPQGLF